MAGDRFLESYGGQTTEQLLAMEADYRIDSLVLAFEQAIQMRDPQAPMTTQERYVLAVEGLEREVNNGGYDQFFLNSSHEFVDVIEDALRAIGCPQTADITRDAIAALGIAGPVTGAKAEEVVCSGNESVAAALGGCDDRFFAGVEPIADRLFEWIRVNKASIRVGGA
jgi:hypothetical protein